MSTKKVLIADDEALIRKLVKDFLKKQDFIVIEAEDGQQALDIFFKEQDFDIVMLDVMMPIYDGWSVCREIRTESNVPIIMLTARDQENDELFGFELGADEYITKPFSLNILSARIQSLLKRTNSTNKSILSFDGLDIDKDKHSVSMDGCNLDLSPTEYDLLFYMAENKGIALSREQLLNSVWGYDYLGDVRTVDTHIKRLRLKLGDKSNFIQTVRGLGYRFEVTK
ncbi:response regulator transcription factor [Clostridium ganghwense]|uniref:Stage 0 sporulation protein A homolog n=1 Tax=Clostridium ganghwense TaxID=312089 RepID=A0ABT4CK95_9CLOT|nr:response regulator transcription factor [Clostridium ganghwense]MCY6369469.1 response regulator transcription factor [Clostridium ganghwense]